ncbi:MAG: glycosyltransferase family 39 protein, partial [Rhodospirillaceae bacterium]|nr:glycosyltransferase family 39 protein [Rhodospirillaceae bacterium]
MSSRNSRPGDSAPPRAATWPIGAWVSLSVALILASLSALLLPYPSPFDEAAHLSYARHVFDHPALLPALDRMRQESGAANYLNHPAPYYLIVGAVDRLAGGAVAIVRLASAALHVAAFALLIDAAAATRHPNRAMAALVCLSVLMPLAHMLGGFVTNDTLAFFTGALVVWSVARSQARPALGYWVGALAVVIAGWTKLTALLAVFPIFALAYAFARPPRIGLRLHLPVAVLVAGLAAIPYLAWQARYGSVAPSLVPTEHDGAGPLTLGFVLSAAVDPEFYGYLWYMLGWLARSAMEPHLLIGFGPAWIVFVAFVAALPVAAILSRRAGNRTMAALFAAGLCAVLAEFAIHALFTYSWFQVAGRAEGFHFRYYIGAAPLL